MSAVGLGLGRESLRLTEHRALNPSHEQSRRWQGPDEPTNVVPERVEEGYPGVEAHGDVTTECFPLWGGEQVSVWSMAEASRLTEVVLSPDQELGEYLSAPTLTVRETLKGRRSGYTARMPSVLCAACWLANSNRPGGEPRTKSWPSTQGGCSDRRRQSFVVSQRMDQGY